MKQVRNILMSLILYCIVGMLIWIVENAILNYDQIIYKFNPIFVILGIGIYLFIIKIINEKLIKKISKIRYIHIIFFIVFFVLSLIIGCLLKLNPSWDMGEVFNIAKSYALNNNMNGSAYLVSYPNNIMITIIYTVVFKINYFLGIKDFITVATIFNACCITATVILTYYIAKIMYNKEKATLALIILLFTTPLYLHVAIYYTDSLSMFFSTLILFMYCLIKKEKNKNKSLFLQIGLGIILIIAWKVKITSVFVAIAIGICLLFNNFKIKKIKNLIVVVITMIVLLVGYNSIIENRINHRLDKQYYQMPIEHWILLGLTENGGFNQSIYEYTNSFSTYNEKKEADILKIKETIKNYSCNDFIKHLTVKLKYAWTDGTYFAPEKLRRQPVKKTSIHEFVLADGKYNKYYKYFPQSMHIGLLVLMIISCIKNIKEKDYASDKMILVISIFGLMVFLLIWENRSRYILTMLPLYILLGIDGVEYLTKLFYRKKGLTNEK